ncbi:MAG: hypothetical protein H6819_06750 [Phycisphaerales bacterium]|nr:hypothetical protein [Phycisphaerales bacterium]MCB9855280.1 hypothetical protein [Phycisphaerales bacterium]MCB9862873.1 hypothetical protein [Phycisphaerales bacterium]
MESLDDATRDAIDQALASHANEGVASIFRRLGLTQRGIKRTTFYDYARRYRERMKSAGKAATLDAATLGRFDDLSNPEMIEKIRRRILVRAIQRLEAGDTKGYEDVALLSRIQEYDKIEINRAADERAAELHRIKVEQMSKDLRSEIEKRTPNGEQMSREDVFDLIDQVMRGEAA